ncbi:MAG TPA: hypothetical protein VMV04_07000 [Thermodesulfobacteriota bacterium]|nr:hypothetical protein [Thermodesulfobacteriota bacterium]
MLGLFQLLLAVFAIYGALEFSDELKLAGPLGCLVAMFVVSRVEKRKLEQQSSRKNYLQSEMDKVSKKESMAIKDQDYSTVEALLWPKSELLLIDTVHSIFKELGFKVSTGINYQSVDRIMKIPETQMAFGVQVLVSEGEVEGNHPKINRALQFNKEKRENEKSLIIAATHIRLPLSEMSQVPHLSKELSNFLNRHNMSLITTRHLYELWQKAKGGEIDILGFFGHVYSHSNGTSSLNGALNSHSSSYNLPLQ